MALHIPCLERLETSLIEDAVLDYTVGDIGAIGFILPNRFPVNSDTGDCPEKEQPPARLVMVLKKALSIKNQRS